MLVYIYKRHIIYMYSKVPRCLRTSRNAKVITAPASYSRGYVEGKLLPLMHQVKLKSMTELVGCCMFSLHSQTLGSLRAS